MICFPAVAGIGARTGFTVPLRKGGELPLTPPFAAQTTTLWDGKPGAFKR